MNVFYDLPNVIQVSILSSWIDITDLRELDVATACPRYLQELREILKSPECVLDHVDCSSNTVGEWILNRKIKMKYIRLNIINLQVKNVRRSLFKIFGHTLETLELICTDYMNISSPDDDDEHSMGEWCLPMGDVAHDCMRYCLVLETFRVVHADLDSTFAELNLGTLKCIILKECTDVSSSVLDILSRSPVLETIALENCRFSMDAFGFTMAAPGSNLTCTSFSLSGADDCTNIQYFTSIFANVKTLQIQLEYIEQLELISLHCKAVTTALIAHRDVEFFQRTATTIATRWQHIENLQIVSEDPESFDPDVDDGVALIFINTCRSLQRLVLAPIDDTQLKLQARPCASEVASQLRELAVSEISEETLVQILDSCKELHTLSIHNLRAEVNEYVPPAEFALHQLQLSSVRELYLGNVRGFMGEHLLQLQFAELHKLVLTNVSFNDVPFEAVVEEEASLRSTDIVELVKHLPRLHTLCLRECSSISHMVVVDVLPVAPSLRHFEYYVEPKTASYFPTPMAQLLTRMVQEKCPHMEHFEVRC